MVGASSRAGQRPLAGRKRGAEDDDGTREGNTAKQADDEEQEGAYHPVACATCGTDVGVVDPQDGVYIFYNVFPSNA